MINKNTAIKVNRVSKSYPLNTVFDSKSNNRVKGKHFLALKDINLSIDKNTALGVIGKNGSGKSTLLRLLAGITPPTEGEVITQGRIAAILEVGSGFHPDLSGKENVFFYSSLLGMKKYETEAAYDSIVEFSEIGEYINEPVKNYSNGMYLRLAFSTLIHSNVDIFLFDEVLSVGDLAFNIKCLSKINELKRDKTIVIVSHTMADIIRNCDLCLWLDNGKIKALGEPNTVASEYLESNWLTSKESNQNHTHTNSYMYKLNEIKENILLQEVKIYENDGEQKNLKGISYNRDFTIEFTIELLQDSDIELFPSIMLIDHTNNPILNSSTMFLDNTEKVLTKIKEKGRYSIRCILKKQTLNIGAYQVYINIFDSEINLVFKNSKNVFFRIISFNDIQKKFLKKSSISLSPALAWSVNQSKNNTAT